MQEKKQFKNSSEVRAYLSQIKRDYRMRQKQKVREAKPVKAQATPTPNNPTFTGEKVNNE